MTTDPTTDYDIIRARALILDGDRVLLMHRIKDGKEFYSLCGGKAEAGETAEQACLREVFEETALRVTLGQEIFRFEDFYEGKRNLHQVFLCRYQGGEPHLNGEERERHTEQNQYHLRWMRCADLSSLTIRPEAIGQAVIAFLGDTSR